MQSLVVMMIKLKLTILLILSLVVLLPWLYRLRRVLLQRIETTIQMSYKTNCEDWREKFRFGQNRQNNPTPWISS